MSGQALPKRCDLSKDPEGSDGVKHLGEENSRQRNKPVQRLVTGHTWKPVSESESVQRRGKEEQVQEGTNTQVVLMLLLLADCLQMFLIYDILS